MSFRQPGFLETAILSLFNVQHQVFSPQLVEIAHKSKVIVVIIPAVNCGAHLEIQFYFAAFSELPDLSLLLGTRPSYGTGVLTRLSGNICLLLFSEHILLGNEKSTTLAFHSCPVSIYAYSIVLVKK